MFPNGREAQMGGDVYIPMADSHWGLTENSKICNYPSIKNVNLIKKILAKTMPTSQLNKSYL